MKERKSDTKERTIGIRARRVAKIKQERERER